VAVKVAVQFGKQPGRQIKTRQMLAKVPQRLVIGRRLVQAQARDAAKAQPVGRGSFGGSFDSRVRRAVPGLQQQRAQSYGPGYAGRPVGGGHRRRRARLRAQANPAGAHSGPE